MNELKKYKFARLINNPNKKRHGWPYTQINDLYNCLKRWRKERLKFQEAPSSYL